MIKHKFNIEKTIEVIGSYNKTKIIDFEIFDDLVSGFNTAEKLAVV